MTEQDRKEIQVQFEKETGTNTVNTVGEFHIDYVSWLEREVYNLRIMNELPFLK